MTRQAPRDSSEDGAVVTFNDVPDVRSVADLFALGMAMEREAADRYEQLCARMSAEGEEDLVHLFRKLQEAEADHENGIAAWAKRENVEPSTSLSFRWDSPEAMTDKDVDEAGGVAMSPWKALAIAVRNEERAFAFYTQIAAQASSFEVREYAESMAREELEHVALLRLERRRAWRGEYSGTLSPLPVAGPPAGDGAEALATYVRAVELENAGRMRAKAQLCRESHEPEAGKLFQELAEEAEARARVAGAAETVPDVHVAPGGGIALMREDEGRLIRLYDGYMRLVETSGVDAVVKGAEEEASVVLARLARLRDERARLSRR